MVNDNSCDPVNETGESGRSGFSTLRGKLWHVGVGLHLLDHSMLGIVLVKTLQFGHESFVFDHKLCVSPALLHTKQDGNWI